MRERGYVSILRIRWRWVVLFVVAGAVIAGILASLTTPSYRAGAQLFVSTRGGTDPTDLVNGSQFSQDSAQSYAKLATSQLVLEPVIRKLHLDTTPQALAGNITASAQLNVVLIDIEVRDSQAARAANIANAVAAQLSTAVDGLEGAAAQPIPAPTSPASPSPGSTSSASTGTPIQVTVVESATAPTSPSSPDTAVYVALGVLAGLVLGVYAAVVRDRVDPRIRDMADVRTVTSVPVIAEVANFAGSDAESPARRGARVEAFRRLRTNLGFLEGGERSRSVVITSATAGEGKSTTAANLALALAETGRSVVLVEANLRKRQADSSDVDQHTGLTDVLVDIGGLDAALQGWDDTGVYILTSGTAPVNPGQALSTEAMTRVLDELGNRFEWVVLDAPPVLPFADALVLAGLGGGTVLVVARGRAHRAEVERSLDALESVHARVYGLVLNFMPFEGATRSDYGYATGSRLGSSGWSGGPVAAAPTTDPVSPLEPSGPGPSGGAPQGGRSPAGASPDRPAAATGPSMPARR